MSRKLFQYHPVFGYSFIPGLKARIDHEGGGYLVRVNDAGFRCDRDVETPRAPDAKRILVFGDSFTAGDGCSNRDRFTDMLETLLPQTEVYNFGLSGSGTDQQYLIWREHAAKMEHDVVVIAVQVENLRRCAGHYRAFTDEEGNMRIVAKPYFQIESNGGLTLHHVPPPREPIDPESIPEAEREHVDWAGRQGRHAWLRKAVNMLGPMVKDVAQRLTRYQPFPEYDDATNARWQLLRAILLKWTAETQKPTLIFPVPFYQYVEETADASGFLARFAELARDTKAVVYNPLPDLHAVPLAQRRGYRFENDAHPSPAGHRALAESLARAVRPLLDPARG